MEKLAETAPASGDQDDSDFEVVVPVKRQRAEQGSSEESTKRGKWEPAEIVQLD